MTYSSRNNGRFNNALSNPNYRCNAYQPGNRQPLSFPQELLESEVNCVREFFEQKQLYYYLCWSSKMQLIDGEFKQYRLSNAAARIPEVIIFNAELHDIETNAELFVVAIPAPAQSQAQFVMTKFMDAQRIAREFGIARTDLPMGSRRKHSFFSADRFQLDSAAQHIAIRDIGEIRLEKSQQYKKEKDVLPSALTHNALNTAIASALEQIKNGSLSFIRIMRIDRKHRQMECVPLIPIKVATVKQWMAVSFRDITRSNSRHNRYNAQSQPQRLEICSLYTNCYWVVSKAALVNPDNVYALHWLTGERPGVVSVCAKEQREQKQQKEQNQQLQRQLSESYQTEQKQREMINTLQTKLSGQLRSYNLMVSLMSDQVRSLQCQLEQQQKIPQTYLAIQIPLPAPSMPMWTGVTPVTTSLESPQYCPNSYVSVSPAPSRSPSPAMLPRLMNAYSAGSNTSLLTSPEREMSPFNLKAEEYVPEAPFKGNMALPLLATVRECESLKFESMCE